MKRNIFSALVIGAAAAAGSAFADDITIDPTPFVSTRSRAEVLADLKQYKRAGINPWSRSYNPLAGFKSQKSRGEVVGEYIAGRAIVSAFNGEDSGSAYLAQGGSYTNGAVRIASPGDR